jgi:hypothetical protein
MDGERFDALAKVLSTTGSRRRVLAGLLGAALAAPRGRAAADQCKADGKACKKNGQCCSGHCIGASGGSTGKGGGTCQPAVTCLGLGAACDPTTSTCCQTPGATTVCADEAGCDAQPPGDTCCRPAGEPCTSTCECCGLLFCTNNLCS